MDLELLFLGTYKRGEFDWTEREKLSKDVKSKSETGKIVKVFDRINYSKPKISMLLQLQIQLRV